MFKGIITAIITPFREGKIDFESLSKIINYQSDNGIEALVVGGSTGEGLLLSYEQKIELLKKSMKLNQGRMKIIASTGSPSTSESIKLSKEAQELGADGLLVISPWYVKPNQESLYTHFKAIHDSTNLPITIYNHPGRCIVDITPETAKRLSDLPRITAFKDSSLDVSRLSAIKLISNPKMKCFSGDDPSAPAYLALGGDGIICVGSNVAPQAYINLYKAWERGDLPEFARLRDALYPLARATNLETNPAPVKYATYLLGLCGTESLLPFVDLQDSTKKALQDALEGLGLKLEKRAA